MIIRNLAVRHGRQTLAAPASRSSLRALWTQTSSPTTAVAEDAEDTSAASTLMAWSKKRSEEEAIQAELKMIPIQHKTYRHIAKNTKGIGSVIRDHYDPSSLVKDPPANATLEMLMAAQAHMGHNTSTWNPANARYIYGVREGIHIISLETIAAHLRRAARVVEEVAYRGGVILFVGTRKGQKPIVVRAAELAGACHLFTRWIPGSITNRDQILRSMPMRMVDELDREIPGFNEHIQERRPIVPDLVICLNPIENKTLLYECGLANIPTIGVIDTDADPTWVTYQIPANDDSLRSIALITGVLGRAGERGQTRRKADAANGIRTWEPAREVVKFIEKDYRRKNEAKNDAEEAMEQEQPSEDEDLANQALRELLQRPL